MDLLSCPAADVAAAVQEHFEQADSARIVDLDPGTPAASRPIGGGLVIPQLGISLNN